MDPVTARLSELARAAARSGNPRFTAFLDPSQADEALRSARDERAKACFWGGYADAERRMAAFLPSEGTNPSPADWPLACVELKWNARYASVGHRDILGAVLALGLDRSRLGDIVLCDACAYAFATPEMAAYIASRLDTVGRASVTCRVTDDLPDMPPPAGHTRRETVPSLRLDAVLAAALNVSRSEAQTLVSRELVRVNHREAGKADAALEAADLVSVRGYGRFRLETVEGETRKGRVAIRLFLYGA